MKCGFGSQDSQCTHEINSLSSLPIDELQYLRQCNNTLLHIEDYGTTASDSSQCIQIFGESFFTSKLIYIEGIMRQSLCSIYHVS